MIIKLNILVLILFFPFFSKAQITNGLWSTGCRDGLKKEQIYGKNNLVISTENFYQDAKCTDESFRFQTIGLVNYHENSNIFIDFIYEELYLSLFKQNVVEDFNTRKVCGYDNWAIAEAQNITGLKCAIFNVNKPTQIPAAGDFKYGIFQILQNKLYYGKLTQNSDGSSPEKRPLEINYFIEYIFQN